MNTNKGYQPINAPVKPIPPKGARSGLVKEGGKFDCCKCRENNK